MKDLKIKAAFTCIQHLCAIIDLQIKNEPNENICFRKGDDLLGKKISQAVTLIFQTRYKTALFSYLISYHSAVNCEK